MIKIILLSVLIISLIVFVVVFKKKKCKTSKIPKVVYHIYVGNDNLPLPKEFSDNINGYFYNNT
jgi:hypothetical protein